MAIIKNSPDISNISQQQQTNIITSDPNITSISFPNFQSPGIVVGTVVPEPTNPTPFIDGSALPTTKLVPNITPNIGTVGQTSILNISATIPVIVYTPPTSPL